MFAQRATAQVRLEPRVYVRAARSALRMSQAQLAKRSGVPQAHLARLEQGRSEANIATLRRLFDAMFCDLLIMPRARKRPGDALAEQYLKRPYTSRAWDREGC